MDGQKKAELSMVLIQMSTLIERLEDMGEQEHAAMSAMPKRSREYKDAHELCDALDDAIDSLTDAIHSLDEVLEDAD